MMNVTFRCPHCEQTSRVGFGESDSGLECPRCERKLAVPAGAVDGRRLDRCLVCSSKELFARKNFSQRLGLTIILLGFLASSVAWFYHRIYTTYAILFATAFLDVILYLTVGNLLQCYRCHAEYREIEGLDQHGAFSLETHERFRQESARLAQHDPVVMTNDQRATESE